jgi:6-phosphofructokinase
MLDFKNHKKVAILFSGGPAPSANAVISSVALNFINARVPIIGFFYGFELSITRHWILIFPASETGAGCF